ncbi:MAG: tRNA (adenosine(37)-N6)-threonylcarbamoyltransferase complex dimerization subunit type 1 TsaB [Flavobacteriales bacterium]|nr:tRNA (adenosine(37)-N6)-threonylcarbamoyltransferase complex dimerization subunit type 1 TsaB [Flavobacteriales bacterium]
MALILGIETATKICSVALSDGEQLLALKEEGGAYSHAEKLNGFIQDVLKDAGLTLNQLDAVAVSKGPGSYTGLRIGVSAAKGLCYALNKPLLAVDTLQAMALRMQGEDPDADLYCPMLDARRMEVYTALYDSDHVASTPITAKIINGDSFSDILATNRVVFFGDGAEKCRELLEVNPNAKFSKEGLPSAAFVNRLAYQKFLNGHTEDVAYFEPYYLKDFIATVPKKLL